MRSAILQNAHHANLAISTKLQGIVVAHLGCDPNDRERSCIFESVGQVLVDLVRLSPGDCPPRTNIFRQTLTQTNQTGNGEDDRNDNFTSAGPVGLGSSGEAIGEEHAETDIQISDHASIASEGICQQNVPKLAILGLGQTANTDPLEGKEKSDAAGTGGAVEGPDQNKEEDNEHRLWDPVQSLYQFRGPSGG